MNSINSKRSFCLFLISLFLVNFVGFAQNRKTALLKIEIQDGAINVLNANGQRVMLSTLKKNADSEQTASMSAQCVEEFASTHHRYAHLKTCGSIEDKSTSLQTSALAMPNLTIYQGDGSENKYQYDEDTHELSINTSVGNYGDAPAFSFRVGYYLSPDEVLDHSDYFVANATHDELPGGYYVNMGASVNLDKVTGLPGGTYYVMFYIDDQENVAESDEDDNCFYFGTPFEFAPEQDGLPNLTLYTGDGSENNYSFESTTNMLTIKTSIQNNGEAGAGAFRVGYYLSVDESIDNSDYLVSSDTRNSLSYGYFTNMSGAVDLDNVQGLSDDIYYVCFYIDDNDQVDESDESDNGYYFTTPIEYEAEGTREPDIRIHPTELTITQ